MKNVPSVSRETQARLDVYADLLIKWNQRINLVSKKSLDGMWTRHFADSAQIHGLAPHPVAQWVDLGSGGGFPGLVVAMIGHDTGSPHHVTLIESDARKVAFLRAVIRETGINATVINDRIEKVAPRNADVLSARALADLSVLLSYAERHMAPDGTALFAKGARWKNELAAAETTWRFSYRVVKSTTEDGPVIFAITGVSRA